jgi:hypothetical protein
MDLNALDKPGKFDYQVSTKITGAILVFDICNVKFKGM